MIFIGTKQTKIPEDCISIFVGRPSVLGNPFYLASEDDRDTCIAKYKTWFLNKVRFGDTAIMEELNRVIRLHEYCDIYLICYCHPRKCHAIVIKEFLDTILEGLNAAR